MGNSLEDKENPEIDVLMADQIEKITGLRYDERIKRWNLLDIGLIEYAAMTFGIIIGGYISSFVKKHLKALLLLVIIFSIKPLIKFLK